MNIFVYGDESGNFDQKHSVFVFGGVIFLDKDSKDSAERRYKKAEDLLRTEYGDIELKASLIKRKHRFGLFRALNHCYRYAFIVEIDQVHKRIFDNKKSKQRYLDYVFRIGLKRFFENLIRQGILNPKNVENIYIRFDEHQTATDGKYELCESIEQEFKIGMFNLNFSTFHEPIFPDMKGRITLRYCDSKDVILIRASDIVANRALGLALNKPGKLKSIFDVVVYFPNEHKS